MKKYQKFELKFQGDLVDSELARAVLRGVIDFIGEGRTAGKETVEGVEVTWTTYDSFEMDPIPKRVVYHSKDMGTVLQLMREGWTMDEEHYRGRFTPNPVVNLSHAEKRQATVARPCFEKLRKAGKIRPTPNQRSYSTSTKWELVP